MSAPLGRSLPAKPRVLAPKRGKKTPKKSSSTEASVAPKPPDTSDSRKLFLWWVGEVRDLLLASEESKADWDEVTKWLKDEEFNARVALSQGRYLARLERDLVEMGRSKKNPMPLLACLNAHSSEYGTIKRGFLDKLLAGFIKSVLKEFKEIAPQALLKQLSDILLREAERTTLRIPN
jgi:hypothetical protein